MAPETTDGAITLQFQDITRVAGETLQGTVDINMQLAQEDNVEQVSITVNQGQSSVTYRQTIVLFHQKTPLWGQGSAYPEPGSHILSVPFSFALPYDLPPSFHCQGANRHATVGYSIEVVGDRPGLFRFNRRIRRPLAIVPAATPPLLLLKEAFLQSWPGPWKSFEREEKLRRGIWGDYAHVRSTITIPDVPCIPIATPFQFSICIETDTKPMKREDAPNEPVDKHGKPLFPPLPPLSSDVKFNLYRWARLRVRSRTRTVENNFKMLKTLGDPTAVASVVQTESTPEWILAPGNSDEKGKGFWRRRVKFEATANINYAPTWQGETLEWEYQLAFIVPFAGIGNDFKINVPIQLGASAPCPPPPLGVAGSSLAGAGVAPTYADVLPPGAPPLLDDLPPAYWRGDHHGWEDDEKKG